MNNIYYIEDAKQHFDSLSLVLKESGYNVYPSEENWASELNAFVTFIHEQSSDENKKILEAIILKYKPDVIIIDVSLGADASGDGEDIYNNFLLKSEILRTIPVIYLTIIGRGSITLSSNVRHVSKILKKLNELDADAIKPELEENIADVLKPPNEKGFLDKFIDSI